MIWLAVQLPIAGLMTAAGTFAAKVAPAPKAARRDSARRALEEAIAEAAALGLTREEIADLFDAALLKHRARLPK